MGTFLKSENDLISFSECFNKFSKGKNKFTYKGVTLKLAKKLNNQTSRINELEKVYNLVTSKNISISESLKEMKKLEKINNLLSSMLQAYIYMKNANKAKAQLLLKDILKNSFDYRLIDSTEVELSIEKQLQIFLFLLRAFNQDLNNPKLMETFIYYFYANTNGKFKLALEEEFDFPQNLNDIRSFYRSNTMGIKFPFVWGPAILEMSSSKEYQAYLDNISLEDKIKTNPEYLFLLKDITNITIPKEKVLEAFDKLYQSKYNCMQLIAISLLETDPFFKYLSANGNYKFGVISNHKRKIFKYLLDNKGLANFAIIHLLDLGDENEAYFYQSLLNYHGL